MINIRLDDIVQTKERILVELSIAAEELRSLGVLVSIPGYDEIEIRGDGENEVVRGGRTVARNGEDCGRV